MWKRPTSCFSDNASLLQVKLKAMKQHEHQVENLESQAQHLVETKQNIGTVQVDLSSFKSKWDNVFERLGLYKWLLQAGSVLSGDLPLTVWKTSCKIQLPLSQAKESRT